MKAVRFSRFGRASDVAGLVDVPEPAVPGAGQVLLEVKVAPINPSDLLHFAGGYSNPAPLPSFAGGDGIEIDADIHAALLTLAAQAS